MQNILRKIKRGTFKVLVSNKGNEFICRKTSSVRKPENMIFNKADGKFYLPIQQIK